MEQSLIACGNSVAVYLGAGMIFGATLTVVCLIFLDILKEKREKKEATGKAS